jgi:NADH-quinone oxidoreductase subunit M
MDFPILSSLILLPLVGSLFILFVKSDSSNNYQSSKYVALFTSFVNFLISIYLWYSFDNSISEFQFIEDKQWLRGFVNYKVGIDGISILFILLTTLITPLSIISINNSISSRLKEFLVAILVMESLMIGVFCSLDLVIFYLFFEGGLIPMFLIIGIWGGSRRVYAAFKFFLFTLLGSVLMLVAIITIYWTSGTTDIIQLYELGIDWKYQNLLWLAFFSSFAVKTPMWPVHTWLPDAHVEAPTAGSVFLAAILLKLAGYGFIRFSIGLFPIASDFFTPLIYSLSLIAIVFISLVALMQDDMKKLIAYSSVAHMGFVTLGIFTLTQQGIEGSIIQMISHGLVSAALFLCVGVLYDRTHSRLISTYGGIVSIMPKYAVVLMIFTLAAIGLPGTSGFIGEFLILLGVFQKSFIVAAIASLGVIFAAAYMLWLYKRVVFGNLINKELLKIPDLNKSEIFILWSLAIPTLFFGFYPEPLINTIEVSIQDLIEMYDLNLTSYIESGEGTLIK